MKNEEKEPLFSILFYFREQLMSILKSLNLRGFMIQFLGDLGFTQK